jgi:hypothetical protein
MSRSSAARRFDGSQGSSGLRRLRGIAKGSLMLQKTAMDDAKTKFAELRREVKAGNEQAADVALAELFDNLAYAGYNNGRIIGLHEGLKHCGTVRDKTIDQMLRTSENMAKRQLKLAYAARRLTGTEE